MFSVARRLLNRAIQTVAADGIFPISPFGTSPVAPPGVYDGLFEMYRNQSHPHAEKIEERMGFAIDQNWLNDLAFQTQVTIKKSELNWQHGRLIYAIIRRHIEDRADLNSAYTIFETGTARGFSAVCAARALIDANQNGTVVTLDTLPHEYPMIWNVASDNHRGPISRASLLDKWPAESERIIFFQGWSKRLLLKLSLANVDFAFLDAQHVFSEVRREYQWVCDRQSSGALILFDDVTPGKYDGVLRAIKLVEQSKLYSVERIQMSAQRGVAIASRY